jgi:hypothetical protein
VRTAPFALLALLLGVCAVMVYRAPVQRYVVACERATQVVCVLEQGRNTASERQRIPLDPGSSAVVRLRPQRRGPARVLLYLESPAHPVFAAEFEGSAALLEAEAAATKLNTVLRTSTPASARIEAVPPPIFRWLSWAGLAVMGLLVVAGYWKVRQEDG